MNNPELDPTSIGNILCEMGVVSKDQLTLLIHEYRKVENMMIGQFLLARTDLTEEQLEYALIKQRYMRKKEGKTLERLMSLATESSSKLNGQLEELNQMVSQYVKAG